MAKYTLIAEVAKRGINIQEVMNTGVSFAKANKIVSDYYKEKGLQVTRSGGFRESYYKFLRTESKTEAQALAFVQKHGSDNDKKKANKGHWVEILKLCEDVRK